MKQLLIISFIALWLYACIVAGEKVASKLNGSLFGLSAFFPATAASNSGSPELCKALHLLIV